MGRAMLIICSGVLIALGLTVIGTNNQAEVLTNSTVSYANSLKAKNTAHLAIEIAINAINQNPGWEDAHNSQGAAWTTTIDGVSTSVWVETVSDSTNASGLQEKNLRIIATAGMGTQLARVSSLYEKSKIHGVPEFKSVISFTSGNFTFLMSDSASVSGSDPIGSCKDMPGVVTTSDIDSSRIANNSNSGHVQGNPAIEVDKDAAYTSFDQLVDYLDGMSDVTHLPPNYSGTLGDSTSPGVFFVDSQVDIKSDINEGYGILVIKNNGKLYYKGNTDISDKLTFKGLVVFEDAWNFKTEFTPSISGSVVLGNPGDHTTDVYLKGPIKITHDCDAQKYARIASALVIDKQGFRRIVTFE